ncbi:hypothetical protein ACFT7S_19590 [Streptomyces sp. NPDC057136]|uniref:hypothetical protein n=1 Tax=Streptomyces sp. NPDC057136 TaxID=3346029 RepID=UPI003629FA08
MNWTKRSAAAAVTAAAVSLITACGASSGDAQSGAAEPVAENKPIVDKANWPKATPERGLAKGLSLPLEDYMQSYEDTVTLDTATRRLQEKCMADYGFDIQLPVAGGTPPPNDNDANMERRYGLTDRDAAAQYGYGLSDALTHQIRQRMPDLTEEQVGVLTGHGKPNKTGGGDVPVAKPAPDTYKGKAIHRGGCVGWSDDRIGQSTIDFQLVSELNGQSLTQSMETPAVKQATSAWSQCMKTKGYDVATPYEAANIVPHAEGGASKEEITVAVAEIDCKEETGLVAIWFKEDSAIQNKQLAEHRNELTGARDRHGKALAAANKSLQG